ncbi:MAG: MBL fold metallo-hydrolase [Clostridiales bacterium]|nr:MBL fold metallo-hydrolase [Clostridiales bacterium]
MIKITENIYVIPGRNKGRFPFCHCVFIKDEVNVLIDSAAGKENLAPVIDKIDVLINTHYHPDHIRGNGLFPNAQILCHEADIPPLTDYKTMLHYTGFEHFTEQEFSKIMPIIDYRESRIDGMFSDGELLDLGRTKLRVIHTPGHSPGHCCFLDENSGILIGGDIDLTPFGPWYGHALSDVNEFERSMQKIIALGADRFISGHEEGYITHAVTQRLKEYTAKIPARDAAIVHALDKPLSLQELSSQFIFYPHHPEPKFFFQFFEQTMLEKHLVRLEKQVKINYVDNKWQRTADNSQ